MEYLGKGLASLGIAIAVACIGWKEPGAGVVGLVFAFFIFTIIWKWD